MLNSLFANLEIESWKPVLTALLLPPVPLLVLALLAARLMAWRRLLGWSLLLLSLMLVWLSCSSAVADALVRGLLAPPPPLSPVALAKLKQEVQARLPTAIVVLGAGRESLAPEYGVSSLEALSLERLRYGVWLSRQTGAPLAFSGGTGHGQTEGAPEAQIAAQIAEREFLRPLRWVEDDSRDTRENARRTAVLLQRDGIQQVLLVTHGWHMPRARRAFEEAAAHSVPVFRVVPAPMGLATGQDRPVLRWLPSSEGFSKVRRALRERFGLWMGA